MMSRRDIQRHIEARAAGRCAYCRMHQSLQGATFHIEPVIPRSRGGHFQRDNLAGACPSGNLRKANRVEVVELDTGHQVPLFNPRADTSDEHFRWDDCRIVAHGQPAKSLELRAALCLSRL